MGNRFGVHGLEAASVHSERDVSIGRISNRPVEVPVTESRSEFGSSCPDPEVSQTKIAPRHNGAQNVGQETSALRRPEDVRREDAYGWSPVALPRYNGAQAVGGKRRMFLAAPKIFGQRKRWSSRLRRGIAASFVYPKTSERLKYCLLYTSPSPRDGLLSRMPSSA